MQNLEENSQPRVQRSADQENFSSILEKHHMHGCIHVGRSVDYRIIGNGQIEYFQVSNVHSIPFRDLTIPQ